MSPKLRVHNPPSNVWTTDPKSHKALSLPTNTLRVTVADIHHPVTVVTYRYVTQGNWTIIQYRASI